MKTNWHRSLLSSRLLDYQPSFTETWRDYTITNICAIFGPLIAAGLAEVSFLGRRYTMAIGAVITAIFFFCYTIIKTPAQNLAISSCICKFTLSIMFFVLTGLSCLHQPLLRNTLRIHC